MKTILPTFLFLGLSLFVSNIYGAKLSSSCKVLPSLHCEAKGAQCGQLSTFTPREGKGYWDYPLNGETEQNQYRSFARRDLIKLIKYASAWTNCVSDELPDGNGQPLGLGDMSEMDGNIPGTSVGSPGHPQGTHVNGRDMDIAYFQIGTANNILRSVCAHTIKGKDQYHCVTEPELLDLHRTAYFLAMLHDSPQLRVIGVDGKIGPMVNKEWDEMCADGFLTGPVCQKQFRRLAYETENKGQGWFRFHHHHFHVSINTKPGRLEPVTVMPSIYLDDEDIQE